MAPVSEHLVPEPGFVRPLRWGVVALGAFNAVDAAAGAEWVRAAAWVVITAVLLVLQLRPVRWGTRVEAGGLRTGSTWRWGRLVAWADVEQVRVQGPYDDASRLRVRGRRRPLRLFGMAVDDVRGLVVEHRLPALDPVGARREATSALRSSDAAAAAAAQPGEPAHAGGEAAADAAMDGPFRRSGPRPPSPAG